MSMLLGFLVFWPMAAAIVSYLIGRVNKQLRNIFAILTAGVELAVIGFMIVSGGVGTDLVIADLCVQGLHFRMNGFNGMYVLIAVFMWFMTLIFSDEYFTHYRNRNRYYLFMLATLGATAGVFLSANLYTTFIFFEIMSFTSYVWVAQDERAKSLKAATLYLAIAVIGGMVLLMGLFLLSVQTGTLEIAELHEAIKQADPFGLFLASCCILFGFAAKAGMYPLHIWLPQAHAVAPAPASALLSGILTKSGMYGILIIAINIYTGDQTWGSMMLIFGAITMFLGAVLAVFSIDLKRTLACSSMSQIGFILTGTGMLVLLGHHGTLAARGTFLHMMNHSLIKLVLFMVAGVVYMNLHELDFNRIRGYGKGKPFLMICYLMGALGIGGIPLWNGYISKTLIHESIVEGIEDAAEFGLNAGFLHTIEWIFLISGGLTLGYMTKIFVMLFLDKPCEYVKHHDKANYMNPVSASAIGLSALILPVLGMLPNMTMDKIADFTRDFFHVELPEHAIHYFSTTNLKGAGISIAIGIVVYFIIIRGLLMGRENGEIVYYDRWPAWLSLETLIYRPLLNPMPYAFILRIPDQLVDGCVYLLRRTVFKDLRKSDEKFMHSETAQTIYKKSHGVMILTTSLTWGLLLFGIGLVIIMGCLLFWK